MQEIYVPSLGQKEPLEQEMATYSSILAWEILWIEQLRSWGCERVGHNLATKRQHQILPTGFSVQCWLLPESIITIMVANSDFVTPFFHIHFLAAFWFCLFSCVCLYQCIRFYFICIIHYNPLYMYVYIHTYIYTHTHTLSCFSCVRLCDPMDCI